MNNDSGLGSLYSADLPYKPGKPMYVSIHYRLKIHPVKCISQKSIIIIVAFSLIVSDPTMDDTLRKSRMSHMRKQLPLPPSHPQNFMPTSSSHHTNSLARTHVPDEEYTTAVYKFADEKVPYRTRIPGKLLTLRQFKDHSPKMTKGNFRYFSTLEYYFATVLTQIHRSHFFYHTDTSSPQPKMIPKTQSSFKRSSMIRMCCQSTRAK